ncbi:ABC transporter permease [Allostreptomyces psammosilenae]|uniref:ABC-type sugar transport system permease subunit n=1 Tax=Allostreptomyces psammosilenae TaxID=1892865 RepID=A0A852ZUY5_9ACTN|nr:ABC transporter permease subunit [Allostreptomyces psammosilenae]NYI06196.1 ABC-type sugar transport system permease subunit [Allostreptomyces psammosilenae]
MDTEHTPGTNDRSPADDGRRAVHDVRPGDPPTPAGAGAPVPTTTLRPPADPPPGRPTRSPGASSRGVAALFLLPALILLGALVVYPIGYSVVRSLFDASGSQFVGLDNYGEVFTDSATLTALRNNAIWVIVAPTVATALGLIFAVLTDRMRWATAFRLVVFMPMAVSMLAAGVIFRLVYDQDPDKGIANAVAVAVHDTFSSASAYPGARPRPDGPLTAAEDGSVSTAGPVQPDAGPAALPLVGLPPTALPDDAAPAALPAGDTAGLAGTVWLDFAPGGGGRPGEIDEGESGLPGVTVQAVRDGQVVAEATTGPDGTFRFPEDAGLAAGAVSLTLPPENFTEQYGGVDWLGPTLVTPAIIASYIWMWAGFAMVLIAAGLSSVPRELQEAARVDGAGEWQVFRRITVPLLAPVLVVVTVTLVINVLKVFDLVYIIAPGATQQDANVLALQLYLASFGGGNDQGLGSALGVLLLLLVLPAMLFNIRRFRRETRR